ncbi:MAG: hypothetical protein AAGI03_17435 [Pseudomonadota bacterium]
MRRARKSIQRIDFSVERPERKRWAAATTIGRLPGSKPKRKRRARLGLSVISIPILAACFGGPKEPQTLWAVSHWKSNVEAFKILERELLADDGVQGIFACPQPGDESCFMRPKEPDEVRLAYEAKYQPLLRDLNFPGPVFFDRKNETDFWLPNMGASRTGPYDIHAALWLRPNRADDKVDCKGYEPQGFRYDCRIVLDETWSLEWRGADLGMFATCNYDGIEREDFEACIQKLEAEQLNK